MEGKARLVIILALKEQGLNQTAIADKLGLSQTYISKITRGITTWNKGAAARDQYGERNPSYQGGISKASIGRRTKEAILASKRSLNVCERCGAYREQSWPRHHKDRDKRNNNPANIEVLCVSCHNKEHMPERDRDIFGRLL